MDELIFVFRSRSQATRFYENLKRYSLSCSLVNTPVGLSTGCGLCVRVGRENFAFAYAQLSRYGYTTFLGVFEYSAQNQRYERLNTR